MAFVVLIYGLIILVGGVIGHQKAASVASLVCGIVFGLLLILSAIGMFKDRIWSYVALGVTFVLDAFFTYRFFKTSQFLPSGLLSLLSIAVLIALAFSLRGRSRS